MKSSHNSTVAAFRSRLISKFSNVGPINPAFEKQTVKLPSAFQKVSPLNWHNVWTQIEAETIAAAVYREFLLTNNCAPGRNKLVALADCGKNVASRICSYFENFLSPHQSLDRNCIYKDLVVCVSEPTDRLEPVLLDPGACVQVEPVLKPSIQFRSTEQQLINDATYHLFNEYSKSVVMVSGDVPSNGDRAGLSFTQNTTQIMTNLLEGLLRLFGARDAVLRVEFSSHWHWHCFLPNVRGIDHPEAERWVRKLWTASLPLHCFQKSHCEYYSFPGHDQLQKVEHYSPEQVRVHVRTGYLDRTEKDSYLGKRTQAKRQKLSSGESIAPECWSIVTPRLKSKAEASVLRFETAYTNWADILFPVSSDWQETKNRKTNQTSGYKTRVTYVEAFPALDALVKNLEWKARQPEALRLSKDTRSLLSVEYHTLTGHLIVKLRQQSSEINKQLEQQKKKGKSKRRR